MVSQAGAVFKLSAADIERRVAEAGFVPRQRNMRYELLPDSLLGNARVPISSPVAA